jgi:hypothetical protein
MSRKASVKSALPWNDSDSRAFEPTMMPKSIAGFEETLLGTI